MGSRAETFRLARLDFFLMKNTNLFFQIMNLSCLLWFLSSLILSQHLSMADEPLEKYDDEEFGIEAGEDENKEFKTKAHFDPGTFYYILSNNPQKNVQYAAQVAPTLGQAPKSTRPVWNYPVSHKQFSWPQSHSPAIENTVKPPTRLPDTRLPLMTPKNIPEQLKILGFNTLAALIGTADLTNALQTPGPFTVFAPTDEVFEKFIGERGEEYENVILGDKDQNLLRFILLQHVADVKLGSTDLRNNMGIKTLAENTKTILDTRDGLTIAGSLFTPGGSNQKAANGIIHAIEDVIYPYVSEEQATTQRPTTRETKQQDPLVIVQSKNGRIRGQNLNEEVRAWLGVPYAEPPVGRYRFSRPRQIKAWDRDIIKDAITYPNACSQMPDEFFGNFSGSLAWNPNTNVSEDCLYLNVFSPRDIEENEVIGKNLPVIVWIHGGGFVTGSASLDMYDPQEIVKLGKVVFVSIQYRLGAHGFLYFGEDSSAPGNVGLLDQTMALEWVHENIQDFGGDPEQVTLMGESAGANSVALHMMSPLSHGLFNRAILQSTGATPRWGFITREEAMKRSIRLAEELDCSYDRRNVEDTLECMRDKKEEDITLLEYYVDNYSLNFFPFVVTIDETFLPMSPRTLLEKKAFKDISVLIGSNTNEGYWSLLYLLPDMFPNNELKMSDRELSQEKYQEAVHQIFSFYPKPMRSLIAHEYMDKFTGRDKLFKSLDQMTGDVDMTCNVEEFAQILASRNNPVYRYFYNHQSSVDTWPTWSGSKHGDELEFTFGVPLRSPKLYSAQEIKFSRDIITYWTNFAKNGSPNPSNSWATWPEYKEPEWKYLSLTVGMPGMNKMSDQCRFFNQVVPEFLPPIKEKPKQID